jgi:hypothetical protein
MVFKNLPCFKAPLTTQNIGQLLGRKADQAVGRLIHSMPAEVKGDLEMYCAAVRVLVEECLNSLPQDSIARSAPFTYKQYDKLLGHLTKAQDQLNKDRRPCLQPQDAMQSTQGWPVDYEVCDA